MRSTMLASLAFAVVAAGCSFDSGVPLADDGLVSPEPDGGPEPSPEPAGEGDGGNGGEPEPEEPTSFALTPTGAPAIAHSDGGGGGDDFIELCPAGRVVTGFDGDDNDSGLCRVQAFCSLLTAHPDGSVTTSDPQPTEIHGTETSVYPEEPIVCAADQVVVGVRTGDASSIIDSLRIRCAPLSWDGVEESYQVGASELAPGRLGDPPEIGGNCDSGQVATGFGGDAGTLLDAFDLYCQPLAATAL